MNASDLRGVFPILATPFQPDGGLDEPALGEYVEWTLARGVDGVVALGIASEMYKLLDLERHRIAGLVLRQVVSRVPVVVGAGHPGGTRAAAEHCRRAEAAGAAAVLVPPPFIARPSAEDMVDYYTEVAQAVSIPVVVQDEPLTTGVMMPAALLARIAEAAPCCRYAKVEHVPTAPKLSAIAALVPDERLGLFGGAGGLYLLEELGHGARGAITGFAFPEVLVEICRRFAAGDRDGAADVFYRWLPLVRLEAQRGIGLAIRKELLRRRGALPRATLRRPAAELDPGTLAELDALLARLGEPAHEAAA